MMCNAGRRKSAKIISSPPPGGGHNKYSENCELSAGQNNLGLQGQAEKMGK